MSTRFTKYGGWRDLRVKADTYRSVDGASLTLDGQGWSCEVDITVESKAVVSARFHESSNEVDDLPNLEDLDPSVLFGNKGARFDYEVAARDSMEKTTMKLSLWLSKQVAPFVGK
jgi:hypothetical protein